MEFVLLVPIAILALLLWQRDHQLESVLRASELARKEQAEQHGRQIATLTAQVQQPELAPSLAFPEPSAEPLHVPMDDEKAWDEYIEQKERGEVR